MRDFCTGCGACSNICGAEAVELTQDQFGFYKEKKDYTSCINCGLCDKVCPFKNYIDTSNESLKYYAVTCNNKIMRNINLGGIIYSLEKYVLNRNGYIFGPSFDCNLRLKHIAVNSENELYRLQKSKYVQSYISEYCLKDVKTLLDKGLWVLFTGTPCQIDGLNNFLGKKYERLITADILCHGVLSTKLYEKIKNYNYNNQEIHDMLKNGYLAGRHCENCKYSNLQRVSDFTLADFTGTKVFNYNKDLSIIFVNNEKALTVFNEMKFDFELCKEISKETIIQNQYFLTFSIIGNKGRDYIYNNIDNMNFNECYNNAKRKYSVGIINFWCANNKGAILTNYALNELVKDLGYIPKTINYIHKKAKPFYYNTICENFTNKYINLTRPCNNKSDLKSLNNDISTFICGSDQIFREDFSNQYGRIFQLDWVSTENKLISLAASFGINKYYASEKIKNLTKHYLSRFDYLSVREFDGVNIMKNTFNLEADQIIDPVFCIEKRKFIKIAETAELKSKEDFIYCYNIFKSSSKQNTVLENAKKYFNVNKVIFSSHNESVEQWLWNIKNAKFIITDSFHCSAFSIIFNKNFITLPKQEMYPSRFLTLIDIFPEIRNNIIFNQERTINYNENIDWNKVNQTIEREKIRSVNWLKNALEAPKKTNLSEEQKMYDAILNKAEEDNDDLKKEIETLKYENRILSYTLKIPILKRKKLYLTILNIITIGLFKNKINKKMKNINFILTEYETYIKNLQNIRIM